MAGLPTYLMDNYGIEAQVAVILTVVTSIINIFGAIAGCKVADISKNKARYSPFFQSLRLHWEY